eukprot:TRINITY_DN12116_c0_g4_i1.p1 TRINITY_DN12116_c0_g4~~TRINITY_DN12116_c0_g4_i1.p1  ORF type:complete len:1227 (+),score=233.93 TRINITY_DN12116_c0_g4_i1:332-3682(+)
MAEERFWAGIAPCSWVEGQVTVRNQLGASPEQARALEASNQITPDEATLLSQCYEGCDRELQLMDHPNDATIKHSAHTTLAIMIGEPNIVAPHTRSIYLSMTSSPHAPVTSEVPVVILGDLLISDKFSMDFPQYFPLMIVYDPPGDGSSATYESFESSVGLRHDSFDVYEGAYGKLDVTKTADKKLSTCKGAPGLLVCTDTLQTSVKKKVSGNHHDLPGKHNGHKRDLTLSTTISLSTSSSAASEHLFVVPSLVIKFSETATVHYNFTTCIANRTDSVKWSLDSKDNVDAFSIIPYSSIKNDEIPTLERNQALEQNNLAALQSMQFPNPAAINQSRAKLDKLEEAIVGWKTVLNYTDHTFKLAAAGNLSDVGHLMPDQLTQSVMDMNLEATPDAQAELKARSALSFYGGGSTYRYQQFSEDTESQSSGHIEWDSSAAGAGLDTSNRAFKGFSIVAEGGVERLDRSRQIVANTSTTRSTNSFVLSDKDAGDKFVIKLARDPLFDTIVFSTIAGISKCNHEINTVAREQPSIVLGASPGGAVLYNEAAIYTVTLRNTAKEAGTYQLYVAEVEGIDVIVNGETLINGQTFRIEAESDVEQQVEVRRVSNRYSFAFKLGIRSFCDGGKDQHLNINVEFLAPCSLVDWARTFRREQTFTVRATDTTGILEVQLNNPQAPERFWTDNDRLEAVMVEYRRENDLQWRAARLVNGSAINFAPDESSFGYAKAEWNVGLLPDGRYQIRAHSRCTWASLDAPEGINEAFSTVLTGVIDRHAPKVFDHSPQPADGIFQPGDHIGIAFTEPIDCNRPLTFGATVELMIEGSRRLLVPRSGMDIACEGRRIELSLVNRISAAMLSGAPAVVTLTHIRDLVGNEIAAPVVWSFVFQELSTPSTEAIDFENLHLAIQYNASMADTTSVAFVSLASSVANAFVDIAPVDSKRIQVVSTTNNSQGNVVVHLRILQPEDISSQRSADEVGMQFLNALEQPDTTPLIFDLNSEPPVPTVLASRSSGNPFAAAQNIADRAGSNGQIQPASDSTAKLNTALIVIFGVLIILQLLFMMFVLRRQVEAVLKQAVGPGPKSRSVSNPTYEPGSVKETISDDLYEEANATLGGRISSEAEI